MYLTKHLTIVAIRVRSPIAMTTVFDYAFIIFTVKRRNDINARKTELKKQNKKLKNGNLKKAGKTKKKIANGVKTKTVTTKKINVKPANKNH